MGLAQEIAEAKEKKKAVVLAHNYQLPEVQDAADFVGDSLELARKASETSAKAIVFAGVDFMAETAKILNPDKKVFITAEKAVCPMAAMLSKQQLLEAKKQHPYASVVLYINSSAECKSLADSCCTSSNADKIVNAMPSDTVLFGPDKNLAHYVQQRTGKKVIPVPANGHCYVHNIIELPALELAIEQHPNATVMVHPECPAKVQEMAGHIASTAGMLRITKELAEKEFIVGTENGMLHRLQKENPGKKFFPAHGHAICRSMKQTSLENVLRSLREEMFEVKVPADINEKALASITKMLELN